LLAVVILQRCSPAGLFGSASVCGRCDLDASGARKNRRAVLVRVDRIENYEPRIINPTIRIFESATETFAQRHTSGVMAQIDSA
jgi:hypothetical protein